MRFCVVWAFVFGLRANRVDCAPLFCKKEQTGSLTDMAKNVDLKAKAGTTETENA